MSNDKTREESEGGSFVIRAGMTGLGNGRLGTQTSLLSEVV